MKYYSDITKQLYDNEKSCADAEARFLQKKKAEEEAATKKSQERKARAEAIDLSYERLQAAQKEYTTLVTEFVRDYGAYHKTYSNVGNDDSLNSLFSVFFN